MNKQLRFTAMLCLLLVVTLIGNAMWVQYFNAQALRDDPNNARVYLSELSRQRGQITAGGALLAQSVPTEVGELPFAREYPQQPLAYGPVLGYFSSQFGTAGVERSENDILAGTADELFSSRTADFFAGRTPRGGNVDLTLIPAAQQVAYEQLSSRGYTGAVVALRPSTGEVLAMASTPSFDPNALSSSDPQTRAAAMEAASADPGQPLLNHASQISLPPGSTFKVITTIAALENGATADTQLTAAREITLPGTATTLENYGGQSCGSGERVALKEAFARSCNTAFVELGIDAGADKLREVATEFGLEQPLSDVGVPTAPATLGPILDDAALGQSSIGQRDVSLTPLHNALIAATIANQGTRMQPHIVAGATAADLSRVMTVSPEELNQPISAEVAATLTDFMLESERFTAGYRGDQIASKTGTAEHGEDSRNSSPHAWYIAFDTAPGSDVAVAVVVENGGDRGQAATGGSVAAPIGRAVIDAVNAAGR